MMIKSLLLDGFLSFAQGSAPVKLDNLNVLIGANGSGKSNFIEALALVRSTPGILSSPIRDGGGAKEWLWKGDSPTRSAKVEIIVDNVSTKSGYSFHYPLRHAFCFTESNTRFEIIDEKIENEKPIYGHKDTYFYYRYNDGNPVINVKKDGHQTGSERTLRRADLDPEKSILAQRRDPDNFPEITSLAEEFEKIRIYRDWSFGRETSPRIFQPADLPNKWLEEDFSNLGLILNKIKNNPQSNKKIKDCFCSVYQGVNDIGIDIENGRVQIFVHEDAYTIPATRLSDGTLHYLCLLAILLNPTLPPVICIEEPEIGLHPDLISNLADILIETSQKTQLIVTTHSVQLLDALNNKPEVVLVCEKDAQNGTKIERLDSKALKIWLEKYSLGTLWEMGQIGGNRW